MSNWRKKRKKMWAQAQVRFRKHRQRNLLAQPGVHSFIIVLDHLKVGYNIPKIFRSAEALGASEVHLIGVDFFDPAPAMGAFKHVPARFYDDFDDCFKALESRGYTFLALDPAAGTDLASTALPSKSAFVFGHEEFGLSFDPSGYSGLQTVRIPQFGRVQSMNVSNAASIVMYEYVRQHNQDRAGQHEYQPQWRAQRIAERKESDGDD